MYKDKLILDSTCGGRTIWFQKQHKDALYCDIREEQKGILTERHNFEVKPDMIVDFRNMPFPDNHFAIAVWDPPHMKGLAGNSWVAKKYGSLDKETWRSDLIAGFNEHWRVLRNQGVLILKWSTTIEGRPSRDIPLRMLLDALPQLPIFGHTTGSKSNTHWLCFFKNEVKNE